MSTEETPDIVVRNGLFLAASRTYGEQYVEPFIRAWYGLEEPDSADHDAVDANGTRYEIKACRVLRASTNRRGTRTLFERVRYENTNLPTNRLVQFSQAELASYDANVQNVKRDHFDYLIYALLFADCIKIFWVLTSDISSGAFVGWSDKHGRYDQLGKSGQFAVNRRTIAWHLANHLKDTVDYWDVAETFSRISGEM